MQRLCNYKFQENYNNSSNMPPRSEIKYEIAKNDQDDPNSMDYYLQHAQMTTKREKSFINSILSSLLIIAIYFMLSVGLTFYNQWLYNDYKFNHPLTVTTCHLLVKWFLSSFIRNLRRCRRVNQQIRLPWLSIFSALAPPGIASGFDVGLSNWAVSLITLSLYTMTKSTTVIFILIFALLFKLERKSWSLVSVVVMISSGLIMFTYKSTQFEALGFILCLLASFSSGIRWTLAQLIMTKSKLGLRNPIDMMYHMQPWMLVAIIPIALWFEGSAMYHIFQTVDWSQPERPLLTSSAVLAGAILAFNMEVMEFLVVTHTSSLTLSISGIVKEICTLVLAWIFKGDEMSGLNFVGLLMCLGGIGMHIIQKISTKKREMIDNLELHSNSVISNGSGPEYGAETNMPLLTDRSTSLTNLLNSNFSSEDEDDSQEKDNTSEVLFNILQRREQS